jgi:hypothetical protein
VIITVLFRLIVSFEIRNMKYVIAVAVTLMILFIIRGTKKHVITNPIALEKGVFRDEVGKIYVYKRVPVK